MDDILRIRNLFIREPDFNPGAGLHVHRVPQLYCCVQGRMRITIEGQRLELRHGEALVVPANLGREVRRHGLGTYLVAIFESGRLDLRGLDRRVLVLGEELRPDFTALVAELRTIGRPDSALLCQVLLLRLLLGLRRQADGEREREGCPVGPAPERIAAQAERIMHKNLHRRLTRADIARSLNVSAPHLARLYKAATGRTLHARLTGMRVDLAKHLLDESTLSAAQIAAEIGVASVSHFTKLFKAAAGCTPSEFRLRHR